VGGGWVGGGVVEIRAWCQGRPHGVWGRGVCVCGGGGEWTRGGLTATHKARTRWVWVAALTHEVNMSHIWVGGGSGRGGGGSELCR
jgi:hypothetical protein